jgi:hypothetical protein
MALIIGVLGILLCVSCLIGIAEWLEIHRLRTKLKQARENYLAERWR